MNTSRALSQPISRRKNISLKQGEDLARSDRPVPVAKTLKRVTLNFTVAGEMSGAITEQLLAAVEEFERNSNIKIDDLDMTSFCFSASAV